MSLRPIRPSEFAHRPGRRLDPPEDIEQRIVVNWLEFHGVPFFAVPNGGHRHPAVAAKLKAQGVSRGVPDLILPTHLVAIEMKRVSGRPSDVSLEQRAWIETLREAGWTCIVAFGAAMAIAKLKDRGIGH